MSPNPRAVFAPQIRRRPVSIAARPAPRTDIPATIVAALIVIIGSGAIGPLFRNLERSSSEILDVQTRTGDLILALPIVVVAVLAALRIASSKPSAIRPTPVRTMVWPAIFMLLSLASCIWTDIPGRTLRRIGLLAAAYVAGIFFYKVLPFTEFRRLATISFVALTLASAVFAVFMPAIGQVSELSGTYWRGLFETKNNFGTALLIASCFYASYLADGKHRARALLALLGSIACAYLAGCRTAIVAILIIVAAAAILATLRRGILKSVDVTLLGLLGAVWLAGIVAISGISLDPSEGILTLGGRTQLWSVLLDAVSVHPWLGYGYESFWRSQSDWIFLSRSQAGWQATGSHNGYIDALLSLGAAGLLAFFLCLWRIMVKGTKQAIAGRNAAAFAVLVGLALITQNLTEAFVFRSGALFTALTVYAYLAVTPLPRPSLTRRATHG